MTLTDALRKNCAVFAANTGAVAVTAMPDSAEAEEHGTASVLVLPSPGDTTAWVPPIAQVWAGQPAAASPVGSPKARVPAPAFPDGKGEKNEHRRRAKAVETPMDNSVLAGASSPFPSLKETAEIATGKAVESPVARSVVEKDGTRAEKESNRMPALPPRETVAIAETDWVVQYPPPPPIMPPVVAPPDPAAQVWTRWEREERLRPQIM